MATATPETKQPDGDSRVAELRRLSDRELRDKAQGLQALLKGPMLAHLRTFPDGGEKIRLRLRAIHDELNRRQHAAPAARPHSSNGEARRATGRYEAEWRHGPVNEATTASPEKLPDGDSRVMELRQLSDRELRDKAQGLQMLLKGTMLARLPDGGEMLRLYLQAILDELNRRQNAPAAACQRDSNGEALRGTGGYEAERRHGPVNEATMALPEKLSSGKVSVGGKGVRLEAEARPQLLSDHALRERMQRLQVLFGDPDGCKRLRLFLETCFREVNNRGSAHVCNCKAQTVEKVARDAAPSISPSVPGGGKRRRGPANEVGTGKAREERVEAELRQLSDRALWERAQRLQEALAAVISARVPGGSVIRLCSDLQAYLRELSDRHQDTH